MITEGTDTAAGTQRRSIADGERIPNVAIFLKRTALEFLQIIFSTRAHGSLRYDSNDTLTEIQISDVHAADLKAVGVRPAIIAVRGPLNWQGLGLGGGAMANRDIRTGDTTYNDLLVGSLALSCISREGIEAEQIAHLVFNSFKFFKPVLQRHGFLSIKSLSIGGEALIESEGSDDKTTVVPVHITAQITDRWKLEKTAHKHLEQIITEHFTSP